MLPWSIARFRQKPPLVVRFSRDLQQRQVDLDSRQPVRSAMNSILEIGAEPGSIPYEPRRRLAKRGAAAWNWSK